MVDVAVNFGPRGDGQINFWIPTLGVDFPFIDHLKVMNEPFRPTGGTGDPFQYIGADGIPTAFISGSTEYTTGIYIYLTDGDDWILDWEGTGTCVLASGATGVSFSTVSSTANSVRISASSDRPVGHIFTALVKITSIGSGFGNPRLYRASHQTILNNGEKWNPDFIDIYKGYGRIRMMDMSMAGITLLSRWEDRPTESMQSWIGGNCQVNNYAGLCTASGNAFTGSITLPGNPSTLADGQLVQAVFPGSITYKTVTDITSGNNPTVTAAGHGYSNGDVIFIYGAPGSNQAETDNFLTATDGKFFTVADVTTDTFTATGLDSTGFTAWSGTASAAKQITFATGNLPRKPLINYVCGSVIPGSTGIFGSSRITNLVYNEVWDAYQARPLLDAGLGMPYELQIEMGNVLNSKLWLCMPTHSTSSFNTNLATLVKNNVHHELRPTVVEYANETWNGGAHANGYCVNMARERFGLLGNGYDAYTGWAHYQMATAWESVFTGESRSHIDLTIAVWTNQYPISNTTTEERLEGTGTGLSEIAANKADSLAIAPYAESLRDITSLAEMIWKYKQGGADATAALAYMDAMLRRNNDVDWNDQTSFTLNELRDTVFPAWKVWADTYGLNLRMYEGGWGYIPKTNPCVGVIDTITWSGGVATVTTVDPHERTGTFNTNIFGTSRAGYFKWWPELVTATVTGASTFTYPLTADPGGSATGGWFGFGGYNQVTSVNDTTAVYSGDWLSLYSPRISAVADNGSGLIRLTVTPNTNPLVTGTQYYVENLWGIAGFTNGYYEVTVIDSTTVDLVGTSYAGSFTGNSEAFSKSRIVSDRQRLYEAYAKSALYATTMQELFAAYEAVGGIEYSQYPIAGAWSDDLMWGTIDVGMTGTEHLPHTTFRAYNDATA